MSINLEAYRDDIEAYLAGAERHVPASRRDGSGGEELVRLRERHADLFNEDMIARLAAAGTADGGADGVEWLFQLAVEGFVDLRVAQASARLESARDGWRDAAAAGQAGDAGRSDGVELPEWDAIARRLAGEGERQRRQAIVAALQRAAETLQAVADDLQGARRAALERLDVESAERRWEGSRGRTVEETAGLAGDLLSRTEETYRKALAATLWRQEGLTAEEATLADLPRFRRAVDLDAILPEFDWRLLDYVAGELGLGDLAREQVSLDAIDAAGPVGGCVASLRVPQRIVARLHRLGPVADLEGLLHLAGTTLPLACTSAELPVEARRLGDPALRVLFVALFEDLAAQPAWLGRALQQSVPPQLPSRLRLLSLQRLRELAAWAGRPAADTVEPVVRLPQHPSPGSLPASVVPDLSAATGFRTPPLEAPFAHATLAAADELVGRLMAPALNDVLARRFGRLWASKPAAGPFLRGIWSEGARRGLGEVAADLGLGAIGADAVVDDWLVELRPLLP